MPLFHFDTSPLTVRPSKDEIEVIKRAALVTEDGRALSRKKRTLMLRWLGYSLLILLIEVVLIVVAYGRGGWALVLHGWPLFGFFALIFFFAAGVLLPTFTSRYVHQWSYISVHQRFTKANGLTYVEGGPLISRNGLPFLQGDQRENIIRYQSNRGPEFEIAGFRYRLDVPVTQTNMSGEKRINWSFIRIALPAGTNAPRIILRPARDLRSSSPTWDLYDRLVPYWLNPGVELQDPANYVLFAPAEAMQVARMFFTPALVALLHYEGALLEAEVIGDQFFIYKRTFPFVLGRTKTIEYLAKVLNTADVSLFGRFPIGPHRDAPKADPTIARDGRTSFPVTGPGTQKVLLPD